MPVLRRKLAPLQSPQRYAALVSALTRITADTLGKRAEVTALLVRVLSATDWGYGGQTQQARKRASVV
jgi:phenylpyruvate tautomerase PptA (4-oxalocrotonate tautomerase family)